MFCYGVIQTVLTGSDVVKVKFWGDKRVKNAVEDDLIYLKDLVKVGRAATYYTDEYQEERDGRIEKITGDGAHTKIRFRIPARDPYVGETLNE